MLGAPIGLVWAACFEREMVREGDMNYKLALNSSFGISSGVPLQSSNPLRQSKTSVIVFISLCARAARAGYTEYYLSRKFKEETGVSLNNLHQYRQNRTGEAAADHHRRGHTGNQRPAALLLPQLFQRGLPEIHRHLPGKIPQRAPKGVAPS